MFISQKRTSVSKYSTPVAESPKRVSAKEEKDTLPKMNGVTIAESKDIGVM